MTKSQSQGSHPCTPSPPKSLPSSNTSEHTHIKGGCSLRGSFCLQKPRAAARPSHARGLLGCTSASGFPAWCWKAALLVPSACPASQDSQSPALQALLLSWMLPLAPQSPGSEAAMWQICLWKPRPLPSPLKAQGPRCQPRFRDHTPCY